MQNIKNIFILFSFDNFVERKMIKKEKEYEWTYSLNEEIRAGTHSFKLIIESSDHAKPCNAHDCLWPRKVNDKYEVKRIFEIRKKL